MKQEPNATSLILITGDLHIPYRISEIPEEIKRVLTQKKNKFEYIISTGASCDKQNIDWLKSLLINENKIGNFIDVKSGGNMENNVNNLKKIESLKIGDFIISVINGHQIVPWDDIEALSSIQKQTGSDILISGFTNKPSIVNYEGKYFINPGSLTGAFSPLHNDPSPSFIILVVSGDCGIFYLYEFNKNTKNFEVSKYDINKIKNEQVGN